MGHHLWILSPPPIQEYRDRDCSQLCAPNCAIAHGPSRKGTISEGPDKVYQSIGTFFWTPFVQPCLALQAILVYWLSLYGVLRERSAKQYQQIVLEKIRKKLYAKLVAILEIGGATGSWNIQIYKNSLINLQLLNDDRLIILIKTNKKAYVRVCCIFKIGDATSTRIYFPISIHAL